MQPLCDSCSTFSLPSRVRTSCIFAWLEHWEYSDGVPGVAGLWSIPARYTEELLLGSGGGVRETRGITVVSRRQPKYKDTLFFQFMDSREPDSSSSHSVGSTMYWPL